MTRLGFTLFGIEETTEVPDERLKPFIAAGRLAGGRLRRSAPITMPDGQPGWAITLAFRGDPDGDTKTASLATGPRRRTKKGVVR